MSCTDELHMLHIELDWTWQFSAFGFFDASLQPRKEAKLPKASHLIPLSTNVSCTRQFSWPFGHVTLQMSMEILFHTNFTSPMSMDSLGIFRSSCDLWTKRNSRPYWLASWVKSVAIPRQRWAVLFKYLPVPPSASQCLPCVEFHEVSQQDKKLLLMYFRLDNEAPTLELQPYFSFSPRASTLLSILL